ncbi:M23 family metallopeptidase [Gemmatimonas aurantiaca]|nr:M23 family metallopeptidase [Gemmatimonas aurantiaca]
MTTKQKTKPPLALRFVRGDEHAVSLSGRQFRVWPPGRSFILICAGALLGLFVLYKFTLDKVADLERSFVQQELALQSYRVKVMELETSLIKAQLVVSQVAELAGVEFDFTPVSDARMSDSASRAERIGGSSIPGLFPRDLAMPYGLPLQGFISRDYADSSTGKFHPGVDVAVGVGTPVLATASGEVIFASGDVIYGMMVIVEHNDSVKTVYAHNSKLLVSEGQPVIAGMRLALSGNTGVSSAPHVHYEVRINNKAVNPGRFLAGAD